MMTPELFAKAYEHGFDGTVRFLLCKGLLREVAEEFAQAAWARGWEARRQLHDERRILPWVNSIAFRAYCNDLRRRKRHAPLVEVADRSHSPATRGAAVDADRLIEHCSRLDQSILHDRYFDGMEMEEIAARRQMTAGAVRVRLHRCKCSLRKLLISPAAGSPPAEGCLQYC